MHIALISLFPEMFSAVADHGVTGRAVRGGQVTLSHVNPRTFTSDVHRTVDDRPYGGGPGMLMKTEPLQEAIAAAREQAGMLRMLPTKQVRIARRPSLSATTSRP